MDLCRLFKVIVGVCILLFIFVQIAEAQSVEIREHKKVPTSKKTQLRIVQKSGVILAGKWQMETSDAVCLKLKSGREIIIAKSDISEVYRCKRQTNFGFFVGFMTGFVTTYLIQNLANSDTDHVFLAPSAVGIGGGLIGAIVGSMHESCEQIDLDEIPNQGVVPSHQSDRDRLLGIRLTFSF